MKGKINFQFKNPACVFTHLFCFSLLCSPQIFAGDSDTSSHQLPLSERVLKTSGGHFCSKLSKLVAELEPFRTPTGKFNSNNHIRYSRARSLLDKVLPLIHDPRLQVRLQNVKWKTDASIKGTESGYLEELDSLSYKEGIEASARFIDAALKTVELDIERLSVPDDDVARYKAFGPQVLEWMMRVSSPSVKSTIIEDYRKRFQSIEQPQSEGFQNDFRNYHEIDSYQLLEIRGEIMEWVEAAAKTKGLFMALDRQRQISIAANSDRELAKKIGYFQQHETQELRKYLGEFTIAFLKEHPKWLRRIGDESREEMIFTQVEILLYASGSFRLIDPLDSLLFRALIEEVISSPYAIKPKKRAVFGDVLFIKNYAQISVWLSQAGKIEKVIFLNLTPSEVEFELKRVIFKAEQKQIAVGSVSKTLSEPIKAVPPVKISVEERLPSASPIASIQQLSFASSDLDFIRNSFEALNQEFRQYETNHDLLEFFSEFLSFSPELQEEHADLQWFFSKLKTRLKSQDRVSSETLTQIFLDDIEHYLTIKNNAKAALEIVDPELKEEDREKLTEAHGTEAVDLSKYGIEINGSIAFPKFKKIIENLGWVLTRHRSSSHIIFSHPDAIRPLTFAVHDKEFGSTLAKIILRTAIRTLKHPELLQVQVAVH
jgi:predicted RNA binding protein YcfA (HicA-like mRNA interferase family)